MSSTKDLPVFHVIEQRSLFFVTFPARLYAALARAHEPSVSRRAPTPIAVSVTKKLATLLAGAVLPQVLLALPIELKAVESLLADIAPEFQDV